MTTHKCDCDCTNYQSPIQIPESSLFVPPASDKIINTAGREKIPVYLFIDKDEPNVLYIKTCDKAQITDNNIYQLNIPSIEFTDSQVAENLKEEFITSPSPAYVSINDVLSLCKNIPIPIDSVVYFIREASKIADYWASRPGGEFNSDLQDIFSEADMKQDYYPFYMFVKYKAVVECIKEFYIEAVSKPSEFHDVLSDLERTEKMDLSAIKLLLDKLEQEADDWLELVATITADPQWALRGKYSFAVTNYNYKPYHPTGLDRTNWSRGY